MQKNNFIPPDLVLFISGVPGAGKTTISYELLKNSDGFRLIEETDIIREILRGYNKYLKKLMPINMALDLNNVYDNTKILSYKSASEQCYIMKHSIKNIVLRQQRKGIPTIINGVHVIPEILSQELDGSHILYINLYLESEESLRQRLKPRNLEKYNTPGAIPYLYNTNVELKKSMDLLSKKNPEQFFSINVSNLGINDTVIGIEKIISLVM